MFSAVALIAVILFITGAVLSYFFGTRALQASRALANYRMRRTYISRARGSFLVSILLLVISAVVLVIDHRLQGAQPLPTPSASIFSTPVLAVTRTTPLPQTLAALATPSPTLEPSASPTPAPTSTPSSTSTPTATSLPSLPISIEALFESSITPAPDIEIGPLRFSTEMSGFQPVGPAVVFRNPIKRMHAVFSHERLAPGTQWTALWYRDGSLVHIDTRPWDGLPTGVSYSLWEQPAESWLPGKYDVLIFIGTEWKTSDSFSLNGQPPTSTSTSTPKPPATSTRTPSATQTAVPTRTASRTLMPTLTRTQSPSATLSSFTLPRILTATPAALLLKAATETETPSPTTTQPPSLTPSPTSTRTPPPTATFTPSPTPTPALVTIRVWFTNRTRLANGTLPYEESVLREAASSDNPVASALEAYFTGPNAGEQNRGLTAVWNGFIGYRRIKFTEGILRVYLVGYCQSTGGGYNITTPLTLTLRQFPDVRYVKIYDEYERTSDPNGLSDSSPDCIRLTFTPTATRTLTPSPTPSITSTASLTPSATPTSTFTPVPTETSTYTPRPTLTPSITPTFTHTPLPTATLTALPTLTFTPSLTPTNTLIPTATLTPSLTPTNTFAPTATPLPTLTRTKIPTATRTPIPTFTRTPNPTATLTASTTPTNTPAPTTTPLPTRTPQKRPSFTPTVTALPSQTATSTLLPSATSTPLPTFTSTSTPVPSSTSTGTPTRTPSLTPTRTSSPTPTYTPSRTPTRTLSPTVTLTSTTTPTSTRTPTRTPTATPDPRCNRAAFIGDVTIPDNTLLPASSSFIKTWRIENRGTCTWTTDYRLVFVNGSDFRSGNSIPLPAKVPPGLWVDLSVNLIAPKQAGLQQAFWMLQSPDGIRFGVGSAYDQPIWVRIRVIEAPAGIASVTPSVFDTLTPPATPVGGNVVLNLGNSACSAQWLNRDTILPCPGTEGTAAGSVLLKENPSIEGREVEGAASILILPGESADASIQGLFPDTIIQAGDRFRSIVSCEQGAVDCSVLFSLGYEDNAGTYHVLWSLGEFYDGQSFDLDLDLSQLAGERIRFILGVSSLGSPVGDRALWVNPRVVNLFLLTVTPGASPTSPPEMSLATPTQPLIPSATPFPPTPASTPEPGGESPSLLTILQRFVEAVITLFQQFFR